MSEETPVPAASGGSTPSAQPSTTSNPGALSNPQVLTAIITGIVTVVAAFVGILPTLIQATQTAAVPTETHTPTATYTLTPTEEPTVVVTQTPLPTDVPATALPVQVQVTVTPLPPVVPQPTILPVGAVPTTVVVEPPVSQPVDQNVQPVQVNPPNTLLIYDDAAFTLVNVSGKALNLDGVRFRSGSGKFNSNKWANYRGVPNNNCVRLRDAAAGRRNPPGECKSLLSLLEIGSDLFWLNTATFEVVRNGETVATCTTDTDRCAVFIPQG